MDYGAYDDIQILIIQQLKKQYKRTVLTRVKCSTRHKIKCPFFTLDHTRVSRLRFVNMALTYSVNSDRMFVTMPTKVIGFWSHLTLTFDLESYFINFDGSCRVCAPFRTHHSIMHLSASASSDFRALYKCCIIIIIITNK